MRKIGAMIIGAMLHYFPTLAQVSLTGSPCVIPGVVYQYNIKGNWDSVTTMQVCVTGGTIRMNGGSGQTCTTPGGVRLDAVQVAWNGSGTLKVTSSKGTASLTVTATSALRPGSIVTATQTQTIPRNGVPLTISCNADTGGACQPHYNYQWQQSLDRVTWVDVPGATGTSLKFSAALKNSLFYRRRVTETASGTIDYSDVASVYVGIGDFPVDSTSINPAQ